MVDGRVNVDRAVGCVDSGKRLGMVPRGVPGVSGGNVRVSTIELGGEGLREDGRTDAVGNPLGNPLGRPLGNPLGRRAGTIEARSIGVNSRNGLSGACTVMTADPEGAPGRDGTAARLERLEAVWRLRKVDAGNTGNCDKSGTPY